MLTSQEYKATFKLDDVTASLEAIHRAMLVSELIMDEAAGEHKRAVEFQLRDKVGMEHLSSKEPYLADEKRRVQLQFVKTMERLFDRVYKYVEGEEKSLFELFDFEMNEDDDPTYLEERPYV